MGLKVKLLYVYNLLITVHLIGNFFQSCLLQFKGSPLPSGKVKKKIKIFSADSTVQLLTERSRGLDCVPVNNITIQLIVAHI